MTVGRLQTQWRHDWSNLELNTWFFVTADYAFGHDLEKMTTSIVEASGGKVLGSVRHPLNTTDFASFLLQAQTSKAKVVAIANGGADTINAIKQAREFGLAQSGQTVIGLTAMISDVHALGLETAQGMVISEAFYWDMNDATRSFSRRWSERNQGRMPTMLQAGVYSAVLQYLKAVAASQERCWSHRGPEDEGKAHGRPLFGLSTLRPDGRAIHPMYLWQVKTPAESKGPWDHLKLLATVPADQAFRPMSEGGCPLVK